MPKIVSLTNHDSRQLLLMDESTNHVDIETLESMSSALNQYEGSVIMVSHNQGKISRQPFVISFPLEDFLII